MNLGNALTYLTKYEEGEMDEHEMIEFFQFLVDSGLAWTLQGSYGRMAMDLIEDGVVVMPEEQAQK